MPSRCTHQHDTQLEFTELLCSVYMELDRQRCTWLCLHMQPMATLLRQCFQFRQLPSPFHRDRTIISLIHKSLHRLLATSHHPRSLVPATRVKGRRRRMLVLRSQKSDLELSSSSMMMMMIYCLCQTRKSSMAAHRGPTTTLLGT